MNLSQDEINALTADGPAESSDSGGDMMSPEAIAAMLDNAAGGTGGAPAAEAPAQSAGGADIMSPEAIAAMLDDAAGGVDPGALSAGDDSAAMLESLISGAEGRQIGEADSGDALENIAAIEGLLSEEEVDILGEIGNISMGAVATTMYSLLDRRVSITTPRVSVFESKDVLSVYRIPFVVATIEYTRGISGTNLLVLKIGDAALITDILMGGDGKVEEAIELNEMHLSAMSEIMNQMMGASSTSLSKLLGTPIDISPPKSTTVDVGFDVSSLLGDTDKVTKISFDMEIEGLLKSELIQLIPYDISLQFAKQFMDVGVGGVQPAASASGPAAASAAPPPPPQPAAPPPSHAAPPQVAAPPPPHQVAPPPPPQAMPMQPPHAMPYPQQPAAMADPYQQPQYAPPYQQMPYPQPYPMAQPQAMAGGRVVDVHPMQFQAFDSPGTAGDPKSIDLVYNIPLQVSVELGRAKKEISEILEFNLGTIIVLDKIAGDPVEIVVNGKLIARGEVVVIDDSYGVRITDIINS